jgi:hypothetical protein
MLSWMALAWSGRRDSTDSSWTVKKVREVFGFDKPAVRVASAEAKKIPPRGKPWTVELQQRLEKMGDDALKRAQERAGINTGD